jgi:hypothetical protein
MKAVPMAANKTVPSRGNVQEFLENIADPIRRDDCKQLTAMMKQITGADPVMWGDSIVGFGSYHYTYASGREGDWFLTGFSPRKNSLTIYLKGYLDHFEETLEGLGKFKRGKGCLYINRLEEIDLDRLQNLISQSIGR